MRTSVIDQPALSSCMDCLTWCTEAGGWLGSQRSWLMCSPSLIIAEAVMGDSSSSKCKYPLSHGPTCSVRTFSVDADGPQVGQSEQQQPSSMCDIVRYGLVEAEPNLVVVGEDASFDVRLAGRLAQRAVQH